MAFSADIEGLLVRIWNRCRERASHMDNRPEHVNRLADRLLVHYLAELRQRLDDKWDIPDLTKTPPVLNRP